MNWRPRLLDLFCGAGGASRGYELAGFDVTGVDIVDQPRYPYRFVRADALDHLAYLGEIGECYDAYAASPPCHDHCPLRHRTGLVHNTGWLLGATRTALRATGRPFVLENVPGAPLRPDVVLCGSMFGLAAAGRVLRRHRWFELHGGGLMLTPPDQCAGARIGGVYGTGGGGQNTRGYKFPPALARQAMGIDWMTVRELSQAIPPAYTEYLGAALLDTVQSDRLDLTEVAA